MIDFADTADVREVTRKVLDDVFADPPEMGIVEWAEEHFRLPKTSAAPGRYRSSYIPYQRGVLEALADERVREVVFASSSQVSKSTIAEIWIAYLMHQQPCGILSVWPTEKKFKAWSRTRLDPMIEDIEVLAEMFERTGRREASDTVSSKEFPRGWLYLLSALSTSDLKSFSARAAIFEEADEVKPDVNDQGDSLELTRARIRTFWNGKLYVPSTPTLDGASRVWSMLESSTWNEFWVPCPHCKEMQTLVWRDASPDEYEAGAYRLIYEKDAGGEVIPGTTCYLCRHCGALIEERHKLQMLRAGEWRARFPGRHTVGFHINTLYSPLTSWDEIARAWLRSHHHPALRKVFYNTWLGLPYKDDVRMAKAFALRDRAERIPEGIEVPHGVGLLTCGVDLQGNRIEAVLWGWMALEEAWALEWARFDGDPGLAKPWDDLDEWLLRPRIHASGAPVMITACAIDAGFQPTRVHRFADARQARRVFAVVGRSGKGKPILKAPDWSKYRRTKKESRPTHVVGSDSAKDMLYARMKIEKVGAEYMHFSDRLDPMFYDQMTADRLVTTYESGFPERVWEAIKGRTNEANRCSGYAIAALEYCGAAIKRQIPEYAKALSEWVRPAEVPSSASSHDGGYGMVSRGVDW